ncbi:Alpha-N-acetylgalactosamine-specific lectin [Holothuria leucospilota]|uniref:Alpha-N-acetylgalactosamine-specific lectin n=1 Tax=Holothuria leucospilota TaxID=206669 RepID=A0A9Q0YIS9_HOLLE|nr:Alpha-N-acetylgalactosamine-specific lectin [Holothuria leucospilota]
MKTLVLLVIVALALIPSSQSLGSCPSPSSCLECPPDWIRWENNCYKYHSEENLNFNEAEAVCNQFVPFKETCSCQTAHLASIGSAEENTFLLEEWRKVRGDSGNASIQRLHIGYTDQAEEGNWQWVDGSSSIYQNWDTYEPNDDPPSHKQNCGLMWKNEDGDNGKWNDGSCYDKRCPFFCKFRLFEDNIQ